MAEADTGVNPRIAPSSTYRLQLNAGFTFDDARRLVPYLARLGVSHLYLSPILQAVNGSAHGYDVLDHSRVSTDLGGRDGLARLAESAHAHGLGLVVDVVPNHMALVPPENLNAPLWDVLTHGRGSAFARWFDVDWDSLDGRLSLPVLATTPQACLASGDLVRDRLDGTPVLRYHDHVFPLAPGTENLEPAEAIDRQHYLLADYHDKESVLNYRRFFEVDTLIAVRVEDPEVFDVTHALLLQLHRDGVVDAFRVDHPDGLADPEAYLRRLREATDGAWLIVEKILEPDETLPDSWPCAGTTGYDALREIQRALLDPYARPGLDALWAELGGQPSFAEVARECKAEVAATLLAPEMTRLAGLAARAAGVGPDAVRDALVTVFSHVDVYRAYLRPDQPLPALAVKQVTHACAAARDERPDLGDAVDLVRRLALPDQPVELESTAGEFAVRFQQTCGPVMAKGVEDTALYRWHRLVALNEVGGDPAWMDDDGPRHLHHWARHQRDRWPTGMTTLSTHDTKRSEDVRARLLAAGADVDGWRDACRPLLAVAEDRGVDLPTAYLVWQTVAGAWPISADRLDGYLLKAIREAKQRTRWTDPDEGYEQAVLALGRAALTDESLRAPLLAWLGHLEQTTRATTLAAKLLQLTLPGVPDVYQGCETVDRSLVDPDNRRPVDFDARDDRLARLDAGGRPRDLDDEKLWLTAQAVRLRRRRPEAFGPGSGYRPVESDSEHLLGFVRGSDDDATVVTLVTRLPFRLAAGGGWRDETVTLPPGPWVDVLGPADRDGGEAACRDLVGDRPVALLERR